MKNIGQGPETLSQRVARRLRARMAELQLRGTEVAAAIGMTQGSFSRRYTGSAAWELDELEMLEAKVGISLAFLLGWDDPASAQPITGAIPQVPGPPALLRLPEVEGDPAPAVPEDPPAPAPSNRAAERPVLAAAVTAPGREVGPIRYDRSAWPGLTAAIA